MAVSLMAYVPNNAVVRCVVNVVQGHGNLCDTKAGGQMAGIDRQFLDYVVAQLLTKLWQLVN